MRTWVGVIYLFICMFFISFLINFFLLILNFWDTTFCIHSFDMPNANPSKIGDSDPSDPVRWWPSWFPQSLTVIGTSL
jgi:hypothetical protein